MKTWHFYDLATGVFTSAAFSGPASCLVVPPGQGAREGVRDWYSQRVDVETGELVDYQPPQPSADHEWNAGARRWVESASAAERRMQRDVARSRVQQLEASQPRAVREAALGKPGAVQRLRAIDDEIETLRPLLR